MPIESGKLRELAAAVERMQEHAGAVREDLKAALDAVKDEGCDPAAMRLCLKLRSGKSTRTKAFLDSFDACRLALGLDDQMDIEDAIATSGKAA